MLFVGVSAAVCACGGNTPAERPAPAQTTTAAAADQDTMAAMFAAGRRVASIVFEPASLELTRGDSVVIRGRLLDEQGNAVTGARWGVQDAPGTDLESIKDRVPDSYVLRATAPAEGAVRAFVALASPDGEMAWRQLGSLPVVVHDYPVARVDIDAPVYAAYTGTSFDLTGHAMTTHGEEHGSAKVTWTAATPELATITPDGTATFTKAGNARFVATADGKSSNLTVEVKANPVRTIRMNPSDGRVRTGDVVQLNVRPLDARGREVRDVRVSYDVSPAGGPSARVFDDGAFVAEGAGTFRVTARAGSASASTQVSAAPRDVHRETKLVGQGPAGTATSDLWVFEGRNGRDYAYTGTMQAATMFAWDVTDAAHLVKTDSITLDGRRINDVKINGDRTIAIATSEGASNRKNGITLLDIHDPAHPQKIVHYTEGLTGGVHNVWIDGNIVYAINDGTLDVHIIDISDPATPHEIGRWGVQREGKYLHDVSVWDGLAYLSYWNDGLIILDVGNGMKGGSPTNPQFVSQYKYQYDIGGQKYGNTHHAYPYTNKAGNSYVFLGDEIFGCPGCENPRGYIHVVDVSDIENPHEVAQFELPNAGTHNIWVEDDKLYIAYYNAGLQVVDVSGELRGDLLAQGRQITHFDTDLASSEENTTMAWGPQPYKGNVFVSDLNTGLWVVKIEPATMTP